MPYTKIRVPGARKTTERMISAVDGGLPEAVGEARFPNRTHAEAAEVCYRTLRSLGLHTTRAIGYRDGYDFLVEGQARVAVRFASTSAGRVHLYTKHNGDVSRYVYKSWTFNFHRHGKMDVRYCDFFVCIRATSADGTGPGPTVFVIPWEAVTGLTFCSSSQNGSARTYHGRYARYRDAWQLIANSSVASSKALGARAGG
ncbi:MAG: hypothetical protein ACE5E4_05465 [Candidatus Binatia bacterium]